MRVPQGPGRGRAGGAREREFQEVPGRARAVFPFTNTIHQIDEKRNQITGGGGICRAQNGDLRDAQQDAFEDEFDGYGERHRRGGRLGAAHARQAGRERLRQGQEHRREGRGADQAREHRPFRSRNGAEQEAGELGRVAQEKGGRRQGDEEGAFDGEQRLFFRGGGIAAGAQRREGGHAGRRQAVTDGDGQVDQRGRAARIQAVESRRVFGIAPDQADDEDAVEDVGQGQDARRHGNGDGGAQQAGRRRARGRVRIKRQARAERRADAQRGAPRPARTGSRPLPAEQKRADAQVPRRAEEHERDRRSLAEGHGKECIRDGAGNVLREQVRKIEAEPDLDGLFEHLGQRRGNEIAAPLEPAAETRKRRYERDAGRQGAVSRRGRRLALGGAHRRGEKKHRRAARQADRGKEKQRAVQQAVRTRQIAGRLRARNGAGQARRDARRRKREQQAVQRIGHLVDPQPRAAQDVGQRDAVKRAQDLGERAAQRDDQRAFEEALLFHMYRAAEKRGGGAAAPPPHGPKPPAASFSRTDWRGCRP